MVRWALRIPGLYKSACANRKLITAVRVAYSQHFARDALGMCGEQLESMCGIFDDRQQSYGSVLHAHLY